MSVISTLDELLEQLGGISPKRIRMRPPPGTATEEDVLEIERRENVSQLSLIELVSFSIRLEA